MVPVEFPGRSAGASLKPSPDAKVTAPVRIPRQICRGLIERQRRIQNLAIHFEMHGDRRRLEIVIVRAVEHVAVKRISSLDVNGSGPHGRRPTHFRRLPGPSLETPGYGSSAILLAPLMNQLFAAYDIQVYTMTTERRSHLIHQKYVDEAEWKPWKEAARVPRESPHLLQSDPILRKLRDVAGINQVLCGTDFPYLS